MNNDTEKKEAVDIMQKYIDERKVVVEYILEKMLIEKLWSKYSKYIYIGGSIISILLFLGLKQYVDISTEKQIANIIEEDVMFLRKSIKYEKLSNRAYENDDASAYMDILNEYKNTDTPEIRDLLGVRLRQMDSKKLDYKSDGGDSEWAKSTIENARSSKDIMAMYLSETDRYKRVFYADMLNKRMDEFTPIACIEMMNNAKYVLELQVLYYGFRDMFKHVDFTDNPFVWYAYDVEWCKKIWAKEENREIYRKTYLQEKEQQ